MERSGQVRPAAADRVAGERAGPATPRAPERAAATGTAVEKAIRRLGYTPNRAARSLVTRRTDSVGLVIPEPTTKLFGDPFFPRLIRGINSVLNENGQLLVLLTPQSDHDERQLGEYLASGHLDGAMLVSLHD